MLVDNPHNYPISVGAHGNMILQSGVFNSDLTNYQKSIRPNNYMSSPFMAMVSLNNVGYSQLSSQLSKSIRKIRNNLDYFVLLEIPGYLDAKGNHLYLYVHKFFVHNALANLYKLLNHPDQMDNRCTLSRALCSNPSSLTQTNDNFWWDTNNDVMIFLGHKEQFTDFVNQLKENYKSFASSKEASQEYLKELYLKIIETRGNILKIHTKKGFTYQIINEDDINAGLFDLGCIYLLTNQPIIFLYKGKRYNYLESGTYCDLVMNQERNLPYSFV